MSDQHERREKVVQDDIEVALAALTAEAPTERLGDVPGVTIFHGLATFSRAEHAGLQATFGLIQRYLRQAKPKRPLCLAVFGPPGSGKSYSVEQIHEALARDRGDTLKLPRTTLNLTQMDDRRAVAEALGRIAGECDGETVPFVFFDEFDCALDGDPLGWLSWFLAPMQDGRFTHRGANVTLERAVYIFAGGTAHTFGRFADPSDAVAFASAKGPDFISRLRGTLDVKGPNAEPRALRRAPILAFAAKKAGVRLEPAFARSMLGVTRYRHGSRSIGALLDVCDLEQARGRADGLTYADLPRSKTMLDLHVDRGPLDPLRIQGPITLSGGGSTTVKQAGCWRHVAGQLFVNGATIVYGGEPDTGLTAALSGVVGPLPDPLIRKDAGTPPARLRLRPPDYVDMGSQPADAYIALEPVQGLSTAESPAPPGGETSTWWHRVRALFRMRLAVAEDAVACIALGGGAPDPSKCRMAGVAEEIMIHLALGRPVYIIGGFGGSARVAGSLLGLERPWIGDSRGLFPRLSDAKSALLHEHRALFCPPPWLHLPTREDELVAFFAEHAAGGPGWPPNGLSLADNRRLFDSQDKGEIARLILSGLAARFG